MKERRGYGTLDFFFLCIRSLLRKMKFSYDVFDMCLFVFAMHLCANDIYHINHCLKLDFFIKLIKLKTVF